MAALAPVVLVACHPRCGRSSMADAEVFGGVEGAQIVQLDEALGLIGLQFRLLAAQAPLCFRHLHPSSRVRIRIRPASNSATMASR